MSKKLLWGLIIIALMFVVLMFNTDEQISVNLRILDFSAMKSLVFGIFIAIGVVIGILLR